MDLVDQKYENISRFSSDYRALVYCMFDASCEIIPTCANP